MIQLRGYQEASRDFLQTTKHAILGDEPGVGKTFPAISAAEREYPLHRKLVVVPAYLRQQWADAIKAYLGAHTPVLLVNRSDPTIPVKFTGWVVISYHTLMTAGVRKHPELLTYQWGAVLFDEAHRLRGRNSQWTKMAQKLRASSIWMLTGTPLVNNPGDLWPLLKLCAPKDYRSYWRFVDQWCVLERTPWATVVGGIKPGMERSFNDMLDAFMLRRQFEDIRAEEEAAGADTSWMDEPIPHFIRVELTPALLKAHNTAKKEWMIEHEDLDDKHMATSGGALVIKLRKLTAGVLEFDQTQNITTNPKINAVVDILDDHPEESTVVFTWFRDTAHAIANRLATEGYNPYCITGDTDADVRAQMVEEWKAGPHGVIVATMSCMQEGANLQKAKNIIFVEHDYLPASVTQAIARSRRYGQTQQVNVFHIMAIGTVDETVWRVMHGRHGNVTKALLEDLFLNDLPATPRLTQLAA